MKFIYNIYPIANLSERDTLLSLVRRKVVEFYYYRVSYSTPKCRFMLASGSSVCQNRCRRLRFA